MSGTLTLEGYTRSRHQLAMSFKLDDLRFTTSYWYSDVDLIRLEQRYGLDFLEKVYFHISAFEASKLVSLRPAGFDLGPFARFHTPAFEQLWRTIFRKVWAQWRYEHDLPDYWGPVFVSAPGGGPPAAIRVEPGPVEVLSFCGGGKDSLVAMKLLEQAAIPYSAFVYSHSIYGTARRQHALINGLLDQGAARARHHLWIFDDALDSPVLDLYPEHGIRSLLAAETPSSIFAAIPLILQHGYLYLSLAHERSADTGNLVWDKTGEEVNHQWGKSLEAEVLLNTYLRAELVTNAQYFSILKPVYDVLIFNLLAQHLDAVPYAHSCNIHKPWCGRCPKCAYVWLNYMAYLPVDLVGRIFAENLLDLPENQLWFRQMLGLEAHTPFECIGQVNEARLAFELCRRKGLTGQAMEVFIAEVPAIDVPALLAGYLIVDAQAGTIPVEIAGKILPLMQAAAQDARLRLVEQALNDHGLAMTTR